MNDLVQFDPGEKPVVTLRKHWFIFMRDISASLIAAVVPFAVWAVLAVTGVIPENPLIDAIGRYLGLLWILVAWTAVFIFWTEYFLDVWIITDRRVFNIQQIGLFHRQATSCELENIQEVIVQTDSFFQTLLHYGTVTIQTAGASDQYIVAEGLPHPERIRALVQAGVSRIGDLEDKNKKQEQLLHMVAHEVKGYLGKNAAVLASIVEGDFGSISDPLKHTASSALSETRTGVSTVMDILEGSNLGTGTVQFTRKPFDLSATTRAAVDAARSLAKEKGLELSLIVDPRACMTVGDEEKIRQHVLRNLIENAIRYTPQGSVLVGVTQTEGRGVAWIQDTGVGITPEDMQKLFTEGGHGSQSRTVNPSSTGFGLFIAKQIVDAMGGNLWAESEGTGRGSKFFLLLPLAAQSNL